FGTRRQRQMCIRDRYGNNGIVAGLFLEFVDFDSLGNGREVYPEGSPYRVRHARLRERFGDLFAWTRARGMRVYLRTDMLTLSEPLRRRLLALPGGMDPRNPELWAVYRAGLEEVFAALPVDGLVLRIGEAGPLYNRPQQGYWSEMHVDDPASLRAMLNGLLPAFEATGRTLIFRSWSVGLGELGELHTDPAVYAAALDGIDSPNLVVSTKFTAGDFYSYLPLNPTLLAGRHRRIVEFQARREYEGFCAFPNYCGPLHQAALQEILRSNSRVEGTYLWTQDGGPLRAGPLSLYPRHGFWLWTDANVYATSRLALDPWRDLEAVTREWAAGCFGPDPEIVDAVVSVLGESRAAVEGGLYIRPFAERSLRVAGIEVPPMLWILEWDMVGGWNAVCSLVYRECREDLPGAVAGGRE
ncbi:MAG: hypothetical protein QUU85_00640, partial [Candidatus Eisenbacteria bacterium]|nr:hypothetical protein [Candidatus Eisenbacteria bacterium]